MKKLDNEFINKVVNEYSDNRFKTFNAPEELKKKLTFEAKESAYVFVLCINQLIDEGFFKD